MGIPKKLRHKAKGRPLPENKPKSASVAACSVETINKTKPKTAEVDVSYAQNMVYEKTQKMTEQTQIGRKAMSDDK